MAVDAYAETVGAAQFGHGRKTDIGTYGLTWGALMGGNEDTLPGYLDASTCWQVVIGLVPGNRFSLASRTKH